MSQCNGRDQAVVFMSPPPGVDWPQAAGPAAQTSARTDDVHWAALETMEDASTRAAGKRPATSKQRQAIFPCRMTKQRMQTSSGSSLERGEDKWSRRSRVAPPCQQWSHHRPLQHRGQARETSSIKPRCLYRRWKKTRWNLPSTRSRDGRGDAPLPHHSANRSCKYLYL